MADADSSLDRTIAKVPLEIDQLSLGATNFEHLAFQDRHSSRVIAAIFQPTQAVHQDIRRAGFASDITDYSTHIIAPELDRSAR
jgi:hypothetical protein